MPELICRTCSKRDGVEHKCAHVVTTFDTGRHVLPEPIDQCPHCGAKKPDLTLPVEQKLWTMDLVTPNEYEYRGSQKVMKDWAQADLEERIGREDADDAKATRDAIETKRKRARELRVAGKTSLTQAEIELIEQSVRAGVDLADSGLVLP